MKKRLILIIFVLVILSVGMLSSLEKTTNVDKKVLTQLEKNNEVRVMIKYKEKPEPKIRLFSTQSKKTISKEKIHHEFENVQYATLTQREIMEISKDENLEIFLEPTKHILLDDSIFLTNSTNIWSKQIQNTNITGLGETICIIDTGINYNHTDFGNCYGNNNASSSCKILGGWDYCSDNSTCSSEDSIPEDVNGHGTHVAGIAAANGSIKGMAPDSKLIILKVFNASGVAWDSEILKAMDWCINNATKFNISIISMSLGNSQIHNSYCDNSIISGIENNPPYRDRINLAKSKNITVTIATGNTNETQNPEEGISSPACIQNATRITALDKDSSFASYAFRHPFFTDIFATFGTNIYSTYNNGGYAIGNGTSMATPMAAGMIALLKQYKKLESNKILTNDEVKEILLNSSAKINDTEGTNTNFSILNSLNMILYSDEQAPNITSMLPENSTQLSQNQSFTCTVTDLQLANLTIKIYNSSTSLIKNQTTTNSSLTLYYQTIDGEYNWSCIAIDHNSNPTIKTNTLSVSNLFVQIQSLAEYTNQNETTFNCSAQSSEKLSNITFSIYNSTNHINTTTKNITGTSNYSLFNYTFLNETNYTYFCSVTNNQSQTSQTKNYTITYDNTAPQITLTSPANNARIISPVTFQYNETETNKDFCNLTIDSTTHPIPPTSRSLISGPHTWSITCTDLANNTNNSTTYNLEISTPTPPSRRSSSSHSPSSSTPPTTEITEEEIKQGTIQQIKEKSKIEFTIKNQKHELTLNSLNTDKAKITIQSNPTNLTIYQNQPRKINLDNDKFYDLELLLLSIENQEANIFIMEINETISMKQIFTNETISSPTPIEETPKLNFFQKIIQFFQKILNYFKKQFSII